MHRLYTILILALSLTAARAYDIALAWEQTDAGTVSYTVYSERTPGAFMALGSTNGLSWTVRGLEAGRTYRFYVTGINQAGESDPSNLVTQLIEATVPAVLQNFWTQAISSSRIDVHWDKPTTNTLTILLERSRDSSTWQQIATVPGSAMHFLDTGLRRDRRYYYRARSCNGMGCSDYTAPRWARTFR